MFPPSPPPPLLWKFLPSPSLPTPKSFLGNKVSLPTPESELPFLWFWSISCKSLKKSFNLLDINSPFQTPKAHDVQGPFQCKYLQVGKDEYGCVCVYCERGRNFGSISVSGQLSTYPSPNSTIVN